jgi:FtsZ-binding cell division protein ZapB
MASRGVKILLRIVLGFVGLIVLVVICLVAWVMFRPLLSGDYSHTYGYVRTVNDLNKMPLVGMVKTVGAPIDAEGAKQLNNRIENTIGQITVVQDEVEDALDSRAGQKDDQLNSMLQDLNDSYDGLQTQMATWQSDGFAEIGAALKSCIGQDGSCTEAIEKADAQSPSSEEMQKLVTALDNSSDGKDTAVLQDAIAEFSKTVDTSWDELVAQADRVTKYLQEKS